MGVRIWHYQFRVDVKPRKVTARAARAFLEGTGALTPAADGYVYLAAIHIELVDRRPVLIEHAPTSRHQVDAQGRWLEHHRLAARRAELAAAYAFLASPATVVPAHERPGGWEPTEAEILSLLPVLIARGVPRYHRDGSVN